jgi:hypothetical protein
VNEIKYLGITITSDLRWNKHVSNIVNKANKVLGLLRRNIYFCNKDAKQAAYFGLVRPLLEYACSIWDPYTAKLTQELDKVQRRAVRFVTSDFYNFEPGTVTNHLIDLGWQPLKKRRSMNSLILFNQGLNGLSSLPLELLTKPTRYSRHMHSEHFNIPYAKTDVYKFSFIPRVVRLWNKLPQSIIDKRHNLDAFKYEISV